MPRTLACARLTLMAAILSVATLLVGGSAAAAHASASSRSAERATRIERVIRVAKRQIGDPWVWGRRGPSSFDCTGLVYYSFRRGRALRAIGGRYRTVAGLWDHFADRGRANRRHPRRGDHVVWGRAKHVGIYLGRGRAISALVSGVRIHRVHQLTDPFTTYLHVRW
jgi:cell wall-associated NlpC family hydrolase